MHSMDLHLCKLSSSIWHVPNTHISLCQGPKCMATSKIIVQELYAHMNHEELIILHVSLWLFPMSVMYIRLCKVPLQWLDVICKYNMLSNILISGLVMFSRWENICFTCSHSGRLWKTQNSKFIITVNMIQVCYCLHNWPQIYTLFSFLLHSLWVFTANYSLQPLLGLE